ncbi:hypothetical protein IW15_01385 [Chryseobacterium soli]|uniref:Uncharacterized protein n=1 Tax=Chryseobacterium soli TaxID=445961 RepID=A0A086ABR1_9FLAO|nr:hypothetical protein [Chryseobacterium soli]KFF14125.1 hypothetical protein IW15_01385 [Chryseobacterium soli]
MEEEKKNIILVSTKNYKTEGIKCTEGNRKIIFLNPKLKDQVYLETEIYKSIFGEDLGKKEFFLKAGSYGNIIEAYENTLITLLEKEHKVPEDYYDRLDEYRKVVYRNLFTLEDYVDNKHRFDEIHEILGDYYVLKMKYPLERIPYEFNLRYIRMKSLYDSGEQLYISSLLNYEELEF